MKQDSIRRSTQGCPALHRGNRIEGNYNALMRQESSDSYSDVEVVRLA